jgi:hypothetical protein
VAIIVFMDGVMRSPTSKVPIFEGISLYKSLNVNGIVALACDDQEEAARWCKEHKLTDVDSFISNKTVGEYPDKDLLKVKHQQTSAPIHLVITADVEFSTTLLENGFKTLLFLHPIYLNAKFRPDGRDGRKSWNELVGELDRQVDLMKDDTRL